MPTTAASPRAELGAQLGDDGGGDRAAASAAVGTCPVGAADAAVHDAVEPDDADRDGVDLGVDRDRDDAGARPTTTGLGRPTRLTVSGSRSRHEAQLDQLADERGDGRAVEAGRAGELERATAPPRCTSRSTVARLCRRTGRVVARVASRPSAVERHPSAAIRGRGAVGRRTSWRPSPQSVPLQRCRRAVARRVRPATVESSCRRTRHRAVAARALDRRTSAAAPLGRRHGDRALAVRAREDPQLEPVEVVVVGAVVARADRQHGALAHVERQRCRSRASRVRQPPPRRRPRR